MSFDEDRRQFPAQSEKRHVVISVHSDGVRLVTPGKPSEPNECVIFKCSLINPTC